MLESRESMERRERQRMLMYGGNAPMSFEEKMRRLEASDNENQGIVDRLIVVKVLMYLI